MDWANLFAEWVVHNTIERKGGYWWFYNRELDVVRFPSRRGIREWLRQRRLLGLPYPTQMEVWKVLEKKPYWLPIEKRYISGLDTVLPALNIAKCHEAGLDVPSSLRGTFEADFTYRKDT